MSDQIKLLFLYIFHYKYVASAVIYFEFGPKKNGNGKKRDGDDGDGYVL
jgi:hypothetical protein